MILKICQYFKILNIKNTRPDQHGKMEWKWLALFFTCLFSYNFFHLMKLSIFWYIWSFGSILYFLFISSLFQKLIKHIVLFTFWLFWCCNGWKTFFLSWCLSFGIAYVAPVCTVWFSFMAFSLSHIRRGRLHQRGPFSLLNCLTFCYLTINLKS